MRIARILPLVFLGLVFSEACLAQELGRLFFTPEQRAALDARRRARLPDKPAAVVTVSPTMRVDGYVRRSGGKSTVFLNGEAADESARVPEAGDSSVSVRVGESGARVRLRPGETLDRGNGEVRDVIGDGEIRIRRAPQGK
jgi:hypothetical protein